jgi:hypothetical protein
MLQKLLFFIIFICKHTAFNTANKNHYFREAKTMNRLKALATATLLSATAMLLTLMDVAVAYFPTLSLSGSNPQPQEIAPDFYS